MSSYPSSCAITTGIDVAVVSADPAKNVDQSTGPQPRTLQEAVLSTVAYGDVFDYPLTAAEVHRYLVGMSAPWEAVQAALTAQAREGALVRRAGWYCLQGREETVAIRQKRQAAASRLWPRALHYARIMYCLPFARMVAVTGALTCYNVDEDDDIDYLVVTESGRLWLCRLLIVTLVRVAAHRGDALCPNYVLSERALQLPDHNLFTAHEVLQMVPVAGLETYAHLRQLNTWTERFLPNAQRQPLCWGVPPGPPQRLKPLTEAVLRTQPGAWIEAWEMRRKVLKLGQQGAGHAEAQFGADWCKGHFAGYGQRTMDAFQQRLRQLAVQGALSSAVPESDAQVVEG